MNNKDVTELEAIYKELADKAHKVYEHSYSPYSKYKVGAAVLWDSGKITTGVNVENASYGLTVCAERHAIGCGVGMGERKIEVIAIAVPTDIFPSPCGACRQVIREFAADCSILLTNGKGEIKISSLKELFPDSFGPEFLENVKP